MNIDSSELLSLAAEYRAACPSESARSFSGFVLINSSGVVYGWKNELRDPQDECPGSFAVGFNGFVYVADGGNDRDGAEAWIECFCPPAVHDVSDQSVNTSTLLLIASKYRSAFPADSVRCFSGFVLIDLSGVACGWVPVLSDPEPVDECPCAYAVGANGLIYQPYEHIDVEGTHWSRVF